MERLLNGRYRIERKIGAGGMAVVYRAFDTLLGRNVAIKVLREQYATDRTFVARFEREAQAIAALVHPNIINIFDVGFDYDEAAGGGIGHYFVMELIDGPNLKELLQARGVLPVAETVAILTQVLSGLGYAHARALIHRDIKPQNIMLTPDGTAKVTDFGIAKGMSDVTLTEAGFGMGTVHYISPEQARGEPASPASDLYAVGVMLYELLTGVLPFTSDSTVAVALKHLQEAPYPPQRLNPAIPAPLAAITLRALAKDPNDRFIGAREMAAALADWPRWRDTRAVASAPPQRSSGGNGAFVPTVGAGRQVPRRSAPPARGGVGWLTWFSGVAVLAALVALLAVGYRLSPFGAVAADPPNPIIAGLPTLPPEPPTATPTPPDDAPTATIAVLPPVLLPATATTRPVGTPAPTLRPTPSPPPATVAPTVTVRQTSPTTAPSPTVAATVTAALASVPNLAGKTLKEAQATAQEAGLVVEQIGAGYSARPVGQVIEQRPAAGQRLAAGGTVTVIISRGPQTVQVPDVKGQGYDQAAAQLDRAGLIAARQNVPSRNVPKDVVLDQDPLPGNTANPGATVTLSVSLGDVALVPDLFGLPFEIARQRLTDAGFVVLLNGQSRAQIEKENPTFFAVYPEIKDGWVISQSLPADSAQARGATIAVAYYKAR